MKNGALRLGDICWLHSAVIDGWLKIEKQHIPSSEHIGLTIVEYRLISDEFSKLYSSLLSDEGNRLDMSNTKHISTKMMV